MELKTIKVTGMTCDHCKKNVERNLGSLDEIQEVDVDLASGKVKISGDEIDLDKVKSTIEKIGYQYAGEA